MRHMARMLLMPLLLSGLVLAEEPAECTAAVEPVAVTTPDAAAPPASAPLPAPPYAAPLRAQAQNILKGPDFHHSQQTRELVARQWLKDWLKPSPKKARPAAMPWNLAVLAQVLKVLLFIALGVALLWLLWRGWQWLAPQRGQRGSGTRRTVQEAQTLALATTALPESISAAARAAWQRGEAVLALSLLYRGAVRSLEQQHRIVLPHSATEGECLRLARRSGKAVVAEGFAPIVRAWIAMAYAHDTPADFEQLLQLYRCCFEPTAGGQA